MKKVTKKIVTEKTVVVYDVGDVVCIKTGYNNECETWGIIVEVKINEKDCEKSSFKMVPFDTPMSEDGEVYTRTAWFSDIIKFTHDGRYSCFHVELKNTPRNWWVS